MGAILSLVGPSSRAEDAGELLTRLKSELASDRAAALVALGMLEHPEEAMLEPIADELLDADRGVRIAAAYTLSRVAVALGCKPEGLDGCEFWRRVLDTTPKATKQPALHYPGKAKAARIHGTVLMQCLVGEDGSVTRIRVISGPEALAPEAVRTLEGWRYKPAKRKGQPVPFALIFAAHFRLS